MISADARTYQLELMDGEDYAPVEYETTLKELETINKLTLGYRPTLQALERVIAAHPELGRTRKLRVLDIGFGYGDTLRAIEAWATRKKVRVELFGIDLNPRASAIARSATSAESCIRYEVGDVFECEKNFGEGAKFDVIVNALFMHHLEDEQIVRLIKWMTAHANYAWFVNDLHRHAVAYHFIKYATALFGFNRMIQNDAPLSVARSFRARDWQNYAREAGVLAATDIRWHMAFRYGVFCETQQVSAQTSAQGGA